MGPLLPIKQNIRGILTLILTFFVNIYIKGHRRGRKLEYLCLNKINVKTIFLCHAAHMSQNQHENLFAIMSCYIITISYYENAG